MSSPSGPIPTVSRVLDDGRLVELVYDAKARKTALAIGEQDGSVTLVPHFDLPDGDRLAPYSARNNLLSTGCILLPSAAEPYEDKASLLADISAYLHRYVDLSPTFSEISAHYVLLSWVYDAFQESPYLRFRGDYGTGKSRALLTIGSICYKPFFASGASTVSPIFHVLDAFQGTLILDEADFRFTDATAALTKILNNGNMAGLPVLRTMTNRNKEFDPRAFRVFGPKIVGMRERFDDDALESRFLTEETGLRPMRAGIPIQVPPEMQEDALLLRNKLLSWRMRERAAVRMDASRAAEGVEARLNQVALPLLSVVDDPAVRDDICNLLKREDMRIHQERSSSDEAALLGVLVPYFTGHGAERPSVMALTRAFNDLRASTLRSGVTPKWIGWFLRTRLRLSTVRTHGVFVVPESERSKVLELAQRYGVAATS